MSSLSGSVSTFVIKTSSDPTIWFEQLNRIFNDLRHRNEDVRQRAAKFLKLYVTAQVRELSADHFTKFLQDLNARISSFVNNSVINEKAGAVLAIDELIDIDYDQNENADKILKFGNYLRIALSTPDSSVLFTAARALGRLVRAAGTLTEFSDSVDTELKRALEWLRQPERYEPRRYAAVLILKEMAINAPTLFNVHINGFIESVYIALTDSNVLIRDTAVEALRACLDVIIEKERHLRLKWYSKLWNEAQQGFKQKEQHPAVHAGLLVLGELLVNTGDFMDGENRYKDTCETIFRYRDSQQKPVRKTVIALLPRLAAYSPTIFCKDYLHASIQFLLSALKKDIEKGRCFLSLGEIALATSIVQFKPHLDAIIPVIKSSFQVKKRAEFCPEALQCAAMLAAAIGPQLKPHMEDLLQDMFTGGLSETLTQTLKTLGQHIPAIMGEIQELLLNYLAVTLGHRPFSGPASGQRTKRTLSVASFHDIQQSMSSSSSKQVVEDDVALALRTLGSFDFAANTNVKNFDSFLIELVRDCVVHYLDNYDPIIRKESALTSARLVGDALTRNTHSPQVVADVLEKLLIVGITEQDYVIRRGILESLDTRYDNLLAEAENLRSLFLALNDEIFEVRELAITIIGRLTIRNPAYVMPSLRKTLVQLLGDLQFSGDSRRKEASTRLLAHLIKASHMHIKPYVDTIIQVLLPKLTEENAHVASYVLSTLGELSLVGGEYMKQYLPTLVPRIIDTLQDQSSANKREGALRTLCKLSSFTGYVIMPYFDYPQLFDILLNEIRTESNAMVRVEVIKTLGVLGGLDPSKYPIKGSSKALVGRKQKQFDDVQTPTVALSSTEGYYHTVAINALVKIMRDPSLSTHYKNSIDVLVNNIMEGLGIKGAQFLPQIMPPFFQIMRNADLNFLETLFTALSKLVTIVKHHIRDYLDDMFELIRSNWSTPLLTQIIFLVEVICKELNDEFKVFLPHLIPPMLKVLHFDTSQRRLATRKVLRALETFGANLEDYLHLVIPAIMNIFEQEDADSEITKLALQTLSRLSHHLNFADYASRIIHPIVRLLAVPLPDPKQKEQYSMALDLRKGALDTLCELVHHLGSDYVIFISMVNKVLSKQNISDARYDTLISRLIRNQPLIEDGETFGQSSDNNNARLSRSNSLAEDILPAAPSPMIATSVAKWKTNQEELKTYWETGQRTTREDWAEWIRRFSVALLRESPSLALRSCNSLAQDYYPLVRELFNAGFISCWSELDEVHQVDLVNNLKTALNINIPAEILQTLLNLAEFMEHEDKRLPIPAKKLSVLAEACSAYAKALYYKEEEFQTNPNETIESLISLNNQLGLPQAADGILIYAEKYHGVQLQESWFEKLNRWDEALESYRKRDTTADTIQGQIRCLHALGEWEDLGKLANSVWDTLNEDNRKLIAPFCAAAAWNTGSWETIEKFVEGMDQRNLTEKSFYQAVLAIHQNQYPVAQGLIDKTRKMLDTELTALMRESYNRSYKLVIFAQQLSELEEVIDYKMNYEYTERRDMIRKVWKERLKGVQRSVDIWTRLLAVRNLVLSPTEDIDVRLKFASICRKNNRVNLAAKTLVKMLGTEPAAGQPLPMELPRVSFAYLKHLWETGSASPSTSSNLRQEAFDRLKEFAPMVKQDPQLQARAYQKLGTWQQQLHPHDEKLWNQVINYFNIAVDHDPNWYNGWHSWALANFEVVSYYEKLGAMDKIPSHLICSIKGFFRSISLSPQQALQDTLRLLTLWFKFGHLKEVESVLLEGFGQLSIDTWLQVIPQIIARIAAPVASVRRLVSELLINVGKEHPQALVFPLNVALKSQAPHRIAAAKAVIEHMRKNHNVLVDQALMVSQELVRVAILWSEMWHEGLEEASKHHFAEHNTPQAIEKLRPLHALLEKGPETMAEEAFLQSDGRDLMEALEWTKRSGQANDFDQAWDLYYNVFRHAKQFINNLTTLQMEYCSPKLLKARDLQLAVPGTYKPGKEVVQISSFVPTLDIIPSKQRPRKLAMSGSDGIMYRFLLKGHDDMRQDERVMQLFGLVNTLLANQFQTSRSHLKIQRYAVVPLAPNSGLVGWVPNCDTLLVLIREYRDARKIHVTHEHRLLLQMSPDYPNLTTIQKLEIFKYALDSTDGKDLKNIIWRQSRTAEVWLERRTHYTRSLAVMSMVGYVLGLGDRHCSNLMLDRKSGKIVHIDFGDCFEVAMLRDKLPERIPFRLTRMLTTAMGVSGYEGTFRNTCENVMRVLRDNKESLMAVLEAFVHDPLIGWRLLTPNDKAKDEEVNDKVTEKPLSIEEDMPTSSKSLAKSLADSEAESTMPEVMNEKAIQIINRISSKLTGKDFSKDEKVLALSVNEQVDRLIKQATDIENLCQCYLGWSPYW